MKPLVAAYDAWTRFWHTPADARLAALLRVSIGLLVFLLFASQFGFVELWWGEHGLVPRRIGRAIAGHLDGSLLYLVPRSDEALWACYSVVLVQSVLLTIGWQARLQAACLFVWLVSFQNRNVAVVDGEDGVFRLVMFLLVFLPISDVFSVDAWLRRRRGMSIPKPHSGWALRMMQLQVAFVFLVAGAEKWKGPTWRDGSAMNAILHLDDVHGRMPELHWLADSAWASTVMSWGTLLFETGIPIAIWFRPTRRLALVTAIVFHLMLEWTMNLLLFEWIMIAAWLAFVDWDADVAWARRWLRLDRKSDALARDEAA